MATPSATTTTLPQQILGASRPLELELHQAEHQHLPIELPAGAYLQVTAEQHGVDLVLSITDPTGHDVLKVDSPTDRFGTEQLHLVATVPGRYELSISAYAAQGHGPYHLEIAGPRAAGPLDQARADATALMFQADQNRAGKDREQLLDALTGYRDAARLWQQAGDRRQQVIALRRRFQVADQLHDLAQAEQAVTQALARCHDPQPLQERWIEAVLLNDAGRVYQLRNQLFRAEQSFAAALQLAQDLGYREAEAKAATNLGYLADQVGDMETAIRQLSAAEQLWLELGNTVQRGRVLTTFGAALSKAGRLAAAEPVLQQAIDLWQARHNDAGVALATTQLGWVRYLQDDLDGAVSLYEEVLPIARRARSARALCAVLGRLATACRERGELDRAEPLYRQSLQMAQDNGLLRSAAHTRCNLAELSLKRGQPGVAQQLAREALAAFTADGNRNGEAHALYVAALAARDQGQLRQAADLLQQTMAIVEQLRLRSYSYQLRTAFYSSRHRHGFRYGEALVEILMALADREGDPSSARAAFVVAEQTRARQLTDLLLESGADLHRGVPEQLLEQERSLRTQLVLRELGSEVMTEPPGPAAEHPATAVAPGSLEDRLARIQALIRQASPAFAALTQPQGLSVDELQQELHRSGATLLSYWLGQERSYVWVVQGDRFAWQELRAGPELEEAARTTHGALAVSVTEEEQAQFAADRLGELLLQPVAGYLGTSQLLVVPDGALHYLPFGALTDPSTGLPLLSRCPVISLPSVRVLRLLRQRREQRQPAPRGFALVGDPVYSTTDPRFLKQCPNGTVQHAAAAPMTGCGFRRLEHAAAEIEGARQLLGTVGEPPLVGLDASRDLLLSGALAGYRNLLLACHGELRPDAPEHSAIVLSCFDHSCTPQDGRVRAFELYGLELQADLVVLSGCSTALGHEVRGEGLIGLTQGFLHAGAGGVIVSLWQVDDRATAALMKGLYRHLLQQEPPTVALRHAQLEIRAMARWRQPSYWAGFILQGDPGA